MTYITGIDVSKKFLDCAFRRDPGQAKAKRRRFKNNSGSYDSLLAWTETLTSRGCQDITFVVEPTCIYHELVVVFLFEAGARVYRVNPARVRKFAEGIGILSKNEVIDADLLTHYGLIAKKLIPYTPLPKDISTLRSLLGNGKSKMCAIGAAMRKLVHICRIFCSYVGTVQYTSAVDFHRYRLACRGRFQLLSGC
jgi:transposase